LFLTDPKLSEESLAFKLVRELEARIGQKKSSKSAATLVVHYEAWCVENKVNSFPTCYETLGGYVANRVFTLNGSTKSLDAVKAAIKNESLHQTQAWLSEDDERRLRRLIARLKYDDTNPVRRMKPIQLAELRQWLGNKDLEDSRELELVLLMYLGHDGLFRLGELLSGLRAGDVRWSLNKDSFDVWLSRSKANQKGDGELVIINDYMGVSAVKLMRRWYTQLDLWNHPERILFPGRVGKTGWHDSKTISQSWVRQQIKGLARGAGLDESKYSGHSLRAGGATDLFVARVPYFLIKKMGRWKSDAAMLYYRCDEDVSNAVGDAFERLSKLVGG